MRLILIIAPLSLMKQKLVVFVNFSLILNFRLFFFACVLVLHMSLTVYVDTFFRRQAECTKTARIQMALPPGGKAPTAGAPTTNLYEELGDSSMWVPPDLIFCLSHPTFSYHDKREHYLLIRIEMLSGWVLYRHQPLSRIPDHIPSVLQIDWLHPLHVELIHLCAALEISTVASIDLSALLLPKHPH